MIEIEQTAGVTTVALNRPEQHNAMTAELIAELTKTFQTLSTDDETRLIILTGRGRSFCAGADLNMMHAAAEQTFAENVAGAEAIFDLMQTVNECPKPVIGRVNGAAIGGGVGLVSCCDIVVAVARAKFGFSEVRLGLVPAVISPFVVAKIGESNARQYFLTGERFRADTAAEIGLVHRVVPNDDEALDAAVRERVDALLMASPTAVGAAKHLIRGVVGKTPGAVRGFTVKLIAECRAGEDGREGMQSFLEKRKPNWQKES